ncbi:hypothetical protein K402DRAFT_393633 [Aulographum hederae CBS 113979]|uniref:Uncharacterized protein n=1 Tax=Aulographum hederae CBS 113979 TaxID=1176131 RepID=A0A6G1H024_9PEZI|nr:hypothetical protein K402DRAFT_393633 [Aulographum hederae CBS 113979]
MLARPTLLTVRTALRSYSTHPSQPRNPRLQSSLATSYLLTAFALPFIPPYIASTRARQDGSYATRPPIAWKPCPCC